MDFTIVHNIAGRIRVRTNPETLRRYQIQALSQSISDINGINTVKVNTRTGSILITYNKEVFSDKDISGLLDNINLEELPPVKKDDKSQSLGWSYIGYQIYRFLQPLKLKPFFTTMGALPHFAKGLGSIRRMKMDVNLLDASAIGAAMLQKDFRSASTLTMLLKTGDYLEEWAKYRSRESLAETMSLNVGQVWIIDNGKETQIPYSQLKKGNHVIVRAGTMIPVDGKVVKGEAMVNESSMTGEPLSVARSAGNTVHAGTALEDGELIVEVLHKGEDTRFQKIVHLIQESEATKADVETKANEIADKVVPFNFGLAGLTYAVSKNPLKASAALSVDYSCAIKLSTPLVFLSAMKEGLANGVFFKGGATLEAMSKVDTIVFDKTGTLTKATPKVAKVVAYHGYTQDEVIKIAACLEEHFPHPVAKAIVNHAMDNKIEHQEEHLAVKYIVAHGIATEYNKEHTVIGSRHFIHEDEKIDISIAEADEENADKEGYSVLYLARGNKLAGLIYIHDPAREEAAEVIQMLRSLGIKYFYMLTGDNKRTAQRVANELGIDSFRGEVLPHEKAEIVKLLKSKGCNVAFVGDGMNDSPALSVANVGIAMKGGADLAQEVADVTLNEPSLYPLVIARLISQKAMKRIKGNNVSAIAINSVLMFLSIFGSFTPATSVWLHNLTTLGLSMRSMSNLLPSKGND